MTLTSHSGRLNTVLMTRGPEGGVPSFVVLILSSEKRLQLISPVPLGRIGTHVDPSSPRDKGLRQTFNTCLWSCYIKIGEPFLERPYFVWSFSFKPSWFSPRKTSRPLLFPELQQVVSRQETCEGKSKK